MRAAESICWMSHTDFVPEPPKEFKNIAYTDECPCAGMSDADRKLYGVQFHPEVTHTEFGSQIIRNFLYDICGCCGDWKMESFVEESVSRYKKSGRKEGASGFVWRR